MISLDKIFKAAPQKFANDADNLGTKFCVRLLLKLLPPRYCDPIAKCPETTKPKVTLATFEFAIIAFPLNNQKCIHCQEIQQEKFNKRNYRKLYLIS